MAKQGGVDRDWSTVVVCVAFGIAIGGSLAVPLSRFLPDGWGATFEVNGQIGDFLGGLLNPVIALLAFIWLRRGVLSQQIELADTKKAIADSAASQKMQVQIAALTALLEVESRSATDLERRLKGLDAALDEVEEKVRAEFAREMLSQQESAPRLKKKMLLAQRESLGEKWGELRDRQETYASKLRDLVPDFQ